MGWSHVWYGNDHVPKEDLKVFVQVPNDREWENANSDRVLHVRQDRDKIIFTFK